MTKTIFPLKSFYIAGVQHRPADIIDPLINSNEQEKIRLVYEPDNKFDPNNAIKVECLFKYETAKEDDVDTDRWEHIGYAPKSDTQIFHLLRRLGVPIHLRLDINPGAEPYRMFLVTAAVEGDETLGFNNAS